MSNEQILIVVCGSTFPQVKQASGDFGDWFTRRLAGMHVQTTIWNAHAEESVPDLTHVIGCIVTGSPAMVTDRAHWSEQLAAWLVEKMTQNIPIFGVCYGHQLLADALGGQVDFQPDGREIGSLLISKTPQAESDPLFADMPANFYAHLTHGQSVIKLPEGAVCLASSQRVSQQAYRIGEHCWGVQFHPEFNQTIMTHYLEAYREQIPAEMHLQLKDHIHDCAEAKSLLPRFVEFCLNNR